MLFTKSEKYNTLGKFDYEKVVSYRKQLIDIFIWPVGSKHSMNPPFNCALEILLLASLLSFTKQPEKAEPAFKDSTKVLTFNSITTMQKNTLKHNGYQCAN